ncbi:MAG: N-acetylmuramoyl-L-alanine amidase [Spirochaetales bacterium]|nr:N-acetylmuramoyl-L-alanine amidase [Spirochaetales bacterium]
MISRLLAILLAVAAGWGSAFAGAQGGSVDLAVKATEWKASFAFDPVTGTGHVLRGQDLVRFRVGTGALMMGNGALVASDAPEWTGSSVKVSPAVVEAIQAWFDTIDEERASRFSVAAILIDPGHGGRDPGAIGEHGSGGARLRIAEKDIVLSVATDLYARLKARWPDKTIMITRAGDSYPSLDERVAMANQVDLALNQAIIYISIHANASFNKKASGYEVWYLNPEYRRTVVDQKKAGDVDEDVLPILNAMLEEEYTTESVFLAKSILEGLGLAVGTDTASRGMRAEEWFVVRNAKMPSVLVELGFVTNEKEARLLADPGYLRKLADGIYNGITSFVDYFETRKGP